MIVVVMDGLGEWYSYLFFFPVMAAGVDDGQFNCQYGYRTKLDQSNCHTKQSNPSNMKMSAFEIRKWSRTLRIIQVLEKKVDSCDAWQRRYSKSCTTFVYYNENGSPPNCPNIMGSPFRKGFLRIIGG